MKNITIVRTIFSLQTTNSFPEKRSIKKRKSFSINYKQKWSASYSWHIYSKETDYLQKAMLEAEHFIHDYSNPGSSVNYGQGKE